MTIKSIMTVDDSEADQFLTRHVIEAFDENIEISEAYDGREALAMLEEMDQHPCVILLDINMPTMNGFEFLEEYNKRDDHSAIIAMLTSSGQDQDKEKTKNFKFVKTYLVKPLRVTDIETLAAKKS